MKLKSIIFVMSCLLVLGVSANVFAVPDTTGEPATSVTGEKNVDLAGASVVLSDLQFSNQQRGQLGITMAEGSHMPAIVIFEFDVDNNEATGGNSVLGVIPSTNCGPPPTKCKAPSVGFDYYISVALRSQADDAGLSNCSSCTGGTNRCGTRGTPVDCGANGTCYPIDESCTTGTDCYVAEGQCLDNGCNLLQTYPMTLLCDDADQPSCGRGLTKGEYQVGYGATGAIMNGSIPIDATYSARGETDLCFDIPWAVIQTEAYIRISQGTFAHPLFDPEVAQATIPRFNVIALFDEQNDGDDFMIAGFNLAAHDWLPDTARVAEGLISGLDDCDYNQQFDGGNYGDVDVDGGDLANFLNEFGRGFYANPCQGCGDDLNYTPAP